MNAEDLLIRKIKEEIIADRRDKMQDALERIQTWKQGKSAFPSDLLSSFQKWGINDQAIEQMKESVQKKTDTVSAQQSHDGKGGIQNSVNKTTAVVEETKPDEVSGNKTEVEIQAYSRISLYLKSIEGDLSGKTDEVIRDLTETFENHLPAEDWYADLSIEDGKLVAEAREKLQKIKKHRISQYLDDSKKSEDINEQKRLFEKILYFDPDNQSVKSALQKLVADNEQLKIHGKIEDFVLRLKNPVNMVELQKVIDELENLRYSGVLPRELEAPLQNGKKQLEEMKSKALLITSHTVFGSLEEKFKAVKEWENSGLGLKVPGRDGGYIDLESAIKTANSEWEKESSSAMAKVVNHIGVYENNPILALQYLIRIIGNPGDANSKLFQYHDDQKKIYEQKFLKIQDLAIKQQKAESLVSEAAQQFNSLEKYKLLKSAFDIFKNLEGLPEKIEDVREKARESLEGKVDHYLQQAREASTLRNFSDKPGGARDYIHKSEALVNEWPGDKNDLNIKKTEIKKTSDEINSLSTRYGLFLQREKQIRDICRDKKPIQEAVTLLENVKNDRQFNPDFSDLITGIEVFLADLRGADEQIRLIKEQIGLEKPDWVIVSTFCEKIILNTDENTVQHKAAKEYLHNAEAELLIKKIRDQINDSKNIKEARLNLNTIKKRYPEFIEKVKSLEDIAAEAERVSPEFKELFLEAEKESISRQISERNLGLEMFRFLANFPTSFLDVSLLKNKEFKLNEYTSDSIQKVDQLEKKIREDLGLLRTARSNPTQNDLKDLAEKAKSLVLLRLCFNSEETDLCEWAEVNIAESASKGLEADGKFEEILEIWNDIRTRYPKAGEDRIKEYSVRSVIYQGNKLINKEKYKEAIDYFEKTIDETVTSDNRYKLALSDAYDKNGQLEEAIRIIDFRSEDGKILERKKELEVKREVVGVKKDISAAKSKFYSAYSNIKEDNQEIDKCVLDLSSGAHEIKTAFDTTQKEQEFLKENQQFAAVRNDEINSISQKLSEVIANLWASNNPSADLSALLLCLIKHELDTDTQISLSDLQNYLGEHGDDRRIRQALINSITSIHGQIDGFNCIDRELATVYQEAELLYWQTSHLKIVSRGVDLGIPEAGYQERVQIIGQIRFSLKMGLKSHQALQSDIPWKTATELNSEEPLLAYIKILRNDPYVSVTKEVKKDVQKFLEWQIIINYFMGVKDHLQSCSRQENEDWTAIIEQIKKTKKYANFMADAIFHNVLNRTPGFKFSTTMPTDYDNYYKWFSSNIETVHGQEELSGWDSIEEYAEKCKENLTKWENWGNKLNRKMTRNKNLDFLADITNQRLPWEISDNSEAALSELPTYVKELLLKCSKEYADWIKKEPQEDLKIETGEMIFTTVTKFGGRLPYRYRLWILTGYSNYLASIIDYYEKGPGEGRLDSFPDLSNTSSIIKNRATDFITNIRNRRSEIQTEINGILEEINKRHGFVSAEEKKLLEVDPENGRRRIRECEEIGPANSDEWENYFGLRLSLYGIEPPPPPKNLWEKILNWLNEKSL